MSVQRLSVHWIIQPDDGWVRSVISTLLIKGGKRRNGRMMSIARVCWITLFWFLFCFLRVFSTKCRKWHVKWVWSWEEWSLVPRMIERLPSGVASRGFEMSLSVLKTVQEPDFLKRALRYLSSWVTVRGRNVSYKQSPNSKLRVQLTVAIYYVGVQAKRMKLCGSL